MTAKAIRIVATAGVLCVAGCATVRPQAAFLDVQRSVDTAVAQQVHWNDGSDADRAVEARVTALLAAPLNGDAAVQVALLNNRRLQAVYENLGVAQAELVGAGLLKNPVFDGSIRFVEGGGSPTVDLGVAFDFLDIFFVGARKRLAEARVEAVTADVTSAVLTAAGATKVAYLNLMAADQTVELRRQVAQAAAASYELARRLRDAGNNTPLDLAYEQATCEEARIALASAEADTAAAREQLSRRMGTWGGQSGWSIAGRLPDVPAEDLPADGLERRAIESSLALRGQRAAVVTTFRELGLTQPLAFLSGYEAGASFERTDGRSELGPAVAAARAKLRQTQDDYYATAVEIRSDVRAAYVRVRFLRARADHYRRVILPLRQSIVGQTQLQFNAMQVGGFQLLAAKRDQVEAAQTYLGLLRDYWVARAGLELALKGGPIGSSEFNTDLTLTRPTSAASTGH